MSASELTGMTRLGTKPLNRPLKQALLTMASLLNNVLPTATVRTVVVLEKCVQRRQQRNVTTSLFHVVPMSTLVGIKICPYPSVSTSAITCHGWPGIIGRMPRLQQMTVLFHWGNVLYIGLSIGNIVILESHVKPIKLLFFSIYR